MSTTDKLGSDESLDLSVLRVDKSYQRPLAENRIARMQAVFQPELFGRLMVNRRDDGSIYVVDGQHRLELAKTLGWQTAPCVVVCGLDVAGEAKLFKDFNTARKNPTWYELHRASVAAGMPDAVGIQAITDTARLTICERTTPSNGRGLKAISPLYTIYHAKDGGPNLLARVLRVLTEAFPQGNPMELLPHALESELLVGMSLFLRRVARAPNFNEARLTQQLRLITPAAILRDARALSDFSPAKSRIDTSVAVVVLAQYNRGLRSSRKLEAFTTETIGISKEHEKRS